MTKRLATSLPLFLFALSAGAAAPKPVRDPRVQLLEQHFVGTWVGTDTYLNGIGLKTLPLRLVITRDERHERLRFDYTFASKGSPDYAHGISFMTFHPDTLQIDIQPKGDEVTTYESPSLAQTLDNGYGDFAITDNGTRKGRTQIFMAHYSLAPTAFTYYWQKTSDGVALTTTIAGTLHRE